MSGASIARSAPLPKAPSRSPLRLLAKRVVTHHLGRFGIAIVMLVMLVALFADVIAPFSPTKMGAGPLLSPPSAQNLFGTDQLGRDLYSQVIYGTRSSLWVVGLAVAISFSVGSIFGMLSGYLGGWVDAVIMRVADALLAIPALIFALAIVAVLGASLTNTMLAIAFVNVAGFARLVRGEVLSLRSQPYIQAVQLQGFSVARILTFHIWPNVLGNVVVYASLAASQALITEAGLSFLGLGVQPPDPAWGRMVAAGLTYYQYWWVSFFPGAAIFLVVIALNFLGDAIRDSTDRRLIGSDPE